MTPTEAQRFELQQKLIEVLRERPANTLMESLPPMDWHELATKDDLAALEDRMNTGFDTLRVELGAKIDAGLTASDTRTDTGMAELGGAISRLDGKTERLVARQTYVILVGLAALITPIYIALFTGAAR